MIFNDFHSKSCVNSMAMLVYRRVVLDEWIMDGLHGWNGWTMMRACLKLQHGIPKTLLR